MSLDNERPTAFFGFPEGYLSDSSKLSNLTELEMVKFLQGNDNTTKIPLLKSLIYRISHGEHFPKILMSLMNCLTSDNKTVKKLSMMVWENVNRYDSTGKLLPESILICNALKTNLEHPNEYIRGATLRCVSKLLDIELLDPILPTIILNLDHHHVYVRRHALMCIQHIASHSQELNEYVSHLADKIFAILTTEYNQTCRYHALYALISLSHDHAIEFFHTISNNLHLQPSLFLEGILQLILLTQNRINFDKNSTQNSAQNSTQKMSQIYIKSLTILIHKICPNIKDYNTNSTNNINLNTGLDHGVIFTIAQTLFSISQNDQNSIKLSIKLFIILLKTTNTNNPNSLRYLIIQNLMLYSQQPFYVPIIAPFVLDLLSILGICDTSNRQLILDLSISLSTPANIDAIIATLRKEYLSLTEGPNSNISIDNDPSLASLSSQSIAMKTDDITVKHQLGSSNETQKYRFMLFETLHKVSIQHPSVLPTIAPLLSLSIADQNTLTGLNALKLTKEIVLNQKNLRKNLIERLCQKFNQIESSEILRGVLWILGEFTGTDVILQHGNEFNSTFRPISMSQCEYNDINMLYNVATFLIHTIGLESFDQQQQFWEYSNKMNQDLKFISQNSQNSPNPPNPPNPPNSPQNSFEIDQKKQYQLQSGISSMSSISNIRMSILQGDLHLAVTFATALTKILLKIYNFHTNITPTNQNALPKNNRIYQQIHSMIALIFTRILKFIPKIPKPDSPSLPQPPPDSIHHILSTNPDYDSITMDQFQYFPECLFMGLGVDVVERISQLLKIVLNPAEFGYIPDIMGNNNDYNGDNIFATSTQAFQQALLHENVQNAVKIDQNDTHNDQNKHQTGTNPIDKAPALTMVSANKRNLHKPVQIRLFKKDLLNFGTNSTISLLKRHEDLNLAVTGVASSNIYQSTIYDTSNSAFGLGNDNNNDNNGQNFSQQGRNSIFSKLSTKKSKKKFSTHQLTGFSDLVYVEAKLNIQMYDIILEITAINQTNSTLQNLSVELQCSSDLTLSTPLQSFSLAPKNALLSDFIHKNDQNEKNSLNGQNLGKNLGKNDKNVQNLQKTNQNQENTNSNNPLQQHPSQTTFCVRFNVNNTETGLICGNLICDIGGSGNTKHIITLQPIIIDISQYLTPSSCLLTDYRTMWSEFEWENKVLISTNITDPIYFINFITGLTNMKCLTPLEPFIQPRGDGGDLKDEKNNGENDGKNDDNNDFNQPEFIAANLYALSSFGEQALLNISVECIHGRLTGCMRVRAKTRGVARSLGDLIKNKQRA